MTDFSRQDAEDRASSISCAKIVFFLWKVATFLPLPKVSGNPVGWDSEFLNAKPVDAIKNLSRFGDTTRNSYQNSDLLNCAVLLTIT